jgi:transposase
MRYELSDYERTAIKPMLPNKPHGVRPVNDRRVLNGIFCFHKRCYSRIVDTMRIRNSLASKGRGNIPPKRNRKDSVCFSPYPYRAHARATQPRWRTSPPLARGHGGISA